MSDIGTPGLSKAEALFKDIAWAGLMEAVKSQYGLNWWPMSAVYDIIANRIFEGFRTFVDITAIQIINESARKEFDRASVNLLLLERDLGLDSPEYKKAKEEAKNALSALVRFGATG